MRRKRTLTLLFLAVYLGVVVLSTHQAFDFDPDDRGKRWFLAVIALTGPWSLIAMVFVILSHGTGVAWTYMYWSFAVLNSIIFYWVCSRFKKPRNGDYFVAPRASSAAEPNKSLDRSHGKRLSQQEIGRASCRERV